MKIETLVFDKIKDFIPATAIKTVLYACVENTSHELFFYSLSEQREFKQCFSLAEEGLLDENDLDAAFSSIADLVREDRRFKPDNINIYTFIFEKSTVGLVTEYHDKPAGIYKIKKDWKCKYLSLDS